MIWGWECSGCGEKVEAVYTAHEWDNTKAILAGEPHHKASTHSCSVDGTMRAAIWADEPTEEEMAYILDSLGIKPNKGTD